MSYLGKYMWQPHFIDWSVLEREGRKHRCAPTSLCIHRLIFLAALTGDGAHMGGAFGKMLQPTELPGRGWGHPCCENITS